MLLDKVTGTGRVGFDSEIQAETSTPITGQPYVRGCSSEAHKSNPPNHHTESHQLLNVSFLDGS